MIPILQPDYKELTAYWKSNAEELTSKDAIVHYTEAEEAFRWTFGSLFHQGKKYASYLRSSGMQEGEVCALIIKHNREFYPLYMGIVLAGLIPAVLAYPNPRLHPEKFREGIEGMAQRSGLDWILSERDTGETLKPLLLNKRTTIKGIKYPLEEELSDGFNENISESYRDENAPLLLQHSSGTTGLQKPVMLSNRAVVTHLKNLASALQLNQNDKIVSWLPFYHDMGLIAALHLPLASGIPLIQIDPFEWVLAPSLLPEIVSKERGTISWLPNFAFNVLADKVHTEDFQDISLSKWRMIINCSEPVRAESHRKFFSRYAEHGLNENSISSSYAMAETTFAVTQTEPGGTIKELRADNFSFLKGRIKPSKEGRILLSSGKPLAGCTVKIVDDSGKLLPENEIGEIAVSSDSLFDGYRNYPEKTAEVLKDGWYFTGDIGFMNDGYLYVTGRKKDIIIVAGNNIYPEDIEYAVGRVKGVIPGRVIAAGEYDEGLGSEQVSVIAETELSSAEEKKTSKNGNN